VALALAVIAGAAWWLRPNASSEAAILTYTVAPVSFDVQTKLSGELKALRNVEIRNQVEGNSTILSIVPEGKFVTEGEELVQLASDTIKDKVEDARIRVENAKAALVNSQESLTIQLKQNESDITTADTNAKLAQFEFDQFDKGDGLIEIATRQTALENAQTDVERKAEDLKRTKELLESGFVSKNDVLDAEIANRDALNKLATAKMNLQVWNKYAEPKQRQTLDMKRNESLRELERTRIKTGASALLKTADVRAKESTLRVEASRLANLETQLANTVIKAPQPGIVIYQSSINTGWNSQGPIEEGAQVRQNQVLIQLPDTTKMQVEIRIAEQQVERLTTGLPAVVTIDTLPGQVFTGKLDKISPVIDNSQRWMNPNLKEFPAQILLDSTPPKVKPGMSAKVEIQVAHLNDVLAVPLQAVFTGGGQSYVFIGSAAQYEKRVVTTGLSSTDQIEVREGLKAGETVLLSRPKGAPEDTPTTASSRPGRKGRRGTAESPATAPAGKAAP